MDTELLILHTCYHTTRNRRLGTRMNAGEDYGFDVYGYLHITRF